MKILDCCVQGQGHSKKKNKEGKKRLNNVCSDGIFGTAKSVVTKCGMVYLHKLVSDVGSRDSSVVWSTRFMIKRSLLQVPAEAARWFSSPGSAFCTDSYFGICSTPVWSQLHIKRSWSFCQKCRWQVTARHMYTMHVASNEVTLLTGAWLYDVHRTCAKMAEWPSFTG